MAATLKTRKPIGQLTVSDLHKFPIWEFCIDEEDVEGHDETWVRPLADQIVPRNMYSLNVAADFTTASGHKFTGFVGVTTVKRKVEINSGVILSGRKRYLFIPNPEFFLFEKECKNLATGLGLRASEVFPINYKLRVEISGETKNRSGKFER